MTHSGEKDSLRMWFLLLPHFHALFPPVKLYHISTGTSYCWLGSTCAGRERMYLHSQTFPIWYLMLCSFIACNMELVHNLTWWHRGWEGWVCCNLLELRAAIWLTVLSAWPTARHTCQPSCFLSCNPYSNVLLFFLQSCNLYSMP